MALIKTANLKFDIVAKTANSTLTVTGSSVPQKFRVKNRRLSYGNTTITDGYITKSYTTTVSSPTREGVGKVDETSTYTVSSTIPYNKSVTIATIALAPAANYKIANKASLEARSNIDGLTLRLEETSTANTFNVICSSTKEISLLEGLVVDLNYIIVSIPTVSTNIIKRIYPGILKVPLRGDNRRIKIWGAPNTPFELSVLDANDNSIITTNNATGVLPSGVKTIYSGKLDSGGRHICYQKFPPLPNVLVTAVNGSMAASGASTIIFDSLSGIIVGDEILVTDANNKIINGGETVKVTAINVSGNPNQCTFSKSITLADNKRVVFRRSTSYKLNLETSGTKDSSINSIYPTYTLTQNIGTIVTFNATTTDGAVTINGGSAGVTHTVSYGERKDGVHHANITYTLGGGRTFTQIANKPQASNFVIASGDAEIDIKVRGTGSGTTTYKVIIDLFIKYGSEDTVVNLNLDNIVTYS